MSPSEQDEHRHGVPNWLIVLLALVFLAGPMVMVVLAVSPMAFVGLVLIGSVASLLAVGRWILGPLARASSAGGGLPQFTLADFLSLLFAIQMSLGLIQALSAIRSRESSVPIDVMACAIGGFIWFINVRRLSQAGIDRPSHRLVLLTVVVPLTYYWPAFVVATLVALFGRPAYDRPPGNVDLLLVLIALLLPLAFVWAAAFVRRMVADSLASRTSSE